MDQGNDPILGIQEELQALKRAVGSYNNELARHTDEIASLLAKNASLEAKNGSLEEKNQAADERISELEKLVTYNENDIAKTTMDEDDDLVAMNKNAYTLLYTSPTCSGPFVVGVVPCLMQFSVFSLFLSDLLNTSSIPPDVATLVRACQIIAIIITFLVDTDLLRALRGLIYREGFDEIAQDFSSFAPWKFYVSNTLMGIQGLLGNIVAFFLIIFADNVFDLLLNFTAIMFVSELDEVLFFLASTGYAGRQAEKMARKVDTKKVKQRRPKGILKYLHLVLFGLTMAAVFVAFSSIVRQQESKDSLAQFVKVELGDEINPNLGLFSGCYQKQLNQGWDARVRYVQTQSDRGQGNFEYCLDDGLQTWVFATVRSGTVCAEQDFALRSAEERSTSFDLLDAKGDQWLVRTGNPISEFQLGEVDPSRFEAECGKVSIQGSTTSEELCPVLAIDGDAAGFSDDHDWSKSFVFLENPSNETVQFYQRPVFVGESPGIDGYELLFFTGRRWVLASSRNLLGGGDTHKIMDLVLLFETPGFWLLDLPTGAVAFLSEAVTEGNDRGTPLGLQWYHSRYADEVLFPFADTSRNVDAIFRCGKCSSRSNPCLYEGTCESDGTCTCRHGATGKLCEIEPFNDGVCNPFFNTEPDGYDGGDCCVATCSNTICGVGDMKFAFGQSLQREGIGFPNCVDPSMVPITILIHTEVGEIAGSGSFESYTVEVLCEEGSKAPLRVALDPSIVGTLNETLYMEDTAGSCLLSFIGIQSWSGLNISYELYDGLDSSSDSMLLMSEEKNILADDSFVMPAAYSRCLKESLAGNLDQIDLYTGSYQDEAFAWLSHDVSKKGGCSSNEEYLRERYALLALSTAEEAPESWISPSDHCLWPRVKCDGSKVIDITYDGNTNGALKGLWAPEFLLLRHLERIDVFRNEFSGGSIPTDISALSALTNLALSNNGLTGTLPSEIGNMRALNRISIFGNSFSGTIPSQVGNLNALTRLALSRNNLSGNVPSEVGKLSFLTALSLHTNNLSGTIPSEVGKLSASFLGLSLSSNSLSGTIPSEIGNMSAMTSITLHKNAVSGTIPSEVGNLGALTRLSLYSNTISGTIPSEIGSMSAMKRLPLYNNTLSGALPSEVGKLSSLTSMILYSNMLSGSLPSEIGNLGALKVLGLQDNTFSGSIPSEVGNLGALTALSLHNNDLSGTLPSEIANMTALTGLSLYNNTLSGSIPTEIFQLDGLEYLNLRDNLLNSSIPTEIGLLTNLETLILSGNMLSGLPTEILQLTKLKELDLSGNLFSEDQVNDIMVALGLMCEETSVEVVVLTTDDLGNGTAWEITMGNGTIVASSGSHTDPDIETDEEGKTCIPAGACTFTIFDQSQDAGLSFEIARLGKVYQINGTVGEEVTDVDICA